MHALIMKMTTMMVESYQVLKFSLTMKTMMIGMTTGMMIGMMIGMMTGMMRIGGIRTMTIGRTILVMMIYMIWMIVTIQIVEGIIFPKIIQLKMKMLW